MKKYYVKFSCLEYTRVHFEMEITSQDRDMLALMTDDEKAEWVSQKESYTYDGLYDWYRHKEYIETSDPPEDFELVEEEY